MSGNDWLVAVIFAAATVTLGWGLIANWTTREHWSRGYAALPRWARVTIVTVGGIALLILAAVLSPIPGPGGLPLTYLALTVLGLEIPLAARLKGQLDGWLKRAWGALRARKGM